jgi:hypothetical protein
MGKPYVSTLEERWYPTGSDATATHRIDAEVSYAEAFVPFDAGEVTLTCVVAYAGPEDKDGRLLSPDEVAVFHAEHPDVNEWLIEQLRDEAVAYAERRVEEGWGR